MNFKNIGILMQNLACDGRFELNLGLNKMNIDASLRVISEMTKCILIFGVTICNKNCRFKKHNDPTFSPFWGNFIRNQSVLFLDKWSYMLTEQQITMTKEIALQFDEIQEKMSDRNLTLCHGDIKSANIFYEKCQNKVYEPYFID